MISTWKPYNGLVYFSKCLFFLSVYTFMQLYMNIFVINRLSTVHFASWIFHGHFHWHLVVLVFPSYTLSVIPLLYATMLTADFSSDATWGQLHAFNYHNTMSSASPAQLRPPPKKQNVEKNAKRKTETNFKVPFSICHFGLKAARVLGKL